MAMAAGAAALGGAGTTNLLISVVKLGLEIFHHKRFPLLH